MRKRIKFNKIILLPISIIILLLIGYYIYYNNSTIYQEFESSSEIEELLTYEEEKLEEKSEEKEGAEMIMVHITGEVKNWGVVELEKGARIIDAVNKAGGFTEEADTQKVNLAYVLTDGIKIYIPSKNENLNDTSSTEKYITEESGDNVITEENNMVKTNNSLVNINKATQTELETLPGIGPSTALKIISYREEQGDFLEVEDIKNVPGIGDSKFENIKQLICV